MLKTSLALVVLLQALRGLSAQGVFLELNNITVLNFDLLTHNDIDTSDVLEVVGGNLVCRTNLTTCCRAGDGVAQGRWHYPTGANVLFNFEGSLPSGQIYRFRRGNQVVRLRRDLGSASTANGIYRCELADQNGVVQTRYVGLYTEGAGVGEVSISEGPQFSLISEDPLEFTLTSMTMGGPPTTAFWTLPNTAMATGDPTLITGVNAIVRHTLTVTERMPGVYMFATTNIRSGPPDTRSITVQAANPPTIQTAVQNGLTSILVSWTAPASGSASRTGYHIFYETGGSVQSVTVGVNAISNTLTTGLQIGATYNISIEARSSELPSARVGPEMVTLRAFEAPTVMTSVLSPTSIRVTFTQPSGSLAAESYDIQYTRVTGAGQTLCANVQDTGATTDMQSPVTITNLEEFSSYDITVTARVFSAMRATTEQAMTSPAVPAAAPRDLVSTTVLSTSITVGWNAVVCIERNGVINNYIVRFGPEGGVQSESTVQSGGLDVAGTYNASGLTPFTNYSFEVAGMNSADTGPFTATLFVVTDEDEPGPVDSLQSSTLPTSITITWNEPQAPNGVITRYEVQYSPQSDPTNTTTVNVALSRTFTLPNVEPGTTFTFQVTAFTRIGRGPSETLTASAVMSTTEPPVATTSGGTTGPSASGSIVGPVIGAIFGVLAAVLIIIVVIIVVVIVLRRRGSPDKAIYSPKATENATVPLKPTRYVKNVADVQEEEFVEPSIEEFPKEARVTEGESVFFPVKVSGFPKPAISWYHDGVEVQADYSTELKEDGSLAINSSEPRHTGVYQMVAKNEAGSTEKAVTLYVNAEGGATPAVQKKTVVLQAIPVVEFGEHVARGHASTNRGLRDQYNALDSGDEHPKTVGLSAANKNLNRFVNIAVYDENRITLKPNDDREDCQREYINACYVDGYSLKRKFIATQGPLPKTLVDFWRLVWQERVCTIVMVTNLKEGTKTKCQQYWPDTSTKKFGPFEVTITDSQLFADYIIRSFKLSLAGSSSRSLKVTQYHFTAWPDHGVPDYATPILAFHRRVISQHKTSRGPMLVHCSAGIGRTGTFICVDMVLEQIKAEQVVDISGIINQLRHQRMKMVQTPEQFVFINDAVLESVTCGDTQISATNLRAAIQKMSRVDSATHKTTFEAQFHVLDQVSPKPSEVNSATASQYPDRNRNTEYLPADRYRVLLKGEHPDYIHAAFVHGYKQQKAFIVTQGPMKSTCRDFWKMVYDRKCGTVVALSELRENGTESSYPYWPTHDMLEFGGYTIELLEDEKLQGFTIRKLSVLENKSGKAHQVTQFHIQNWTPDGKCSNMKTVVDAIDEVAKVQRKTGNRPIVVHCSDTVSRSGMFCAIVTTIERCKTEGVVDVFQVVKALRVQKPGAVLTVDQYQAVFEAVLVFLDSFDTYANFQNV